MDILSLPLGIGAFIFPIKVNYCQMLHKNVHLSNSIYLDNCHFFIVINNKFYLETLYFKSDHISMLNNDFCNNLFY